MKSGIIEVKIKLAIKGSRVLAYIVTNQEKNEEEESGPSHDVCDGERQ